MAAAHATRTTTRTTRLSRRCVSTRTHPYDTTQQRSRSTQHSAAQHRSKHTTPSVPRTYVRTSSLAESQPAGQIRSDLHQRRHPRRRRRRTVPYTTSKQG
uniref:(northern house mosquito) hypothetical protein n=1 Tax=Culex pipiens TaxID=7175 RepID=A0A8D8B440_CULPI